MPRIRLRSLRAGRDRGVRMLRARHRTVVVLAVLAVTTACSSGPSTQAEVCTDFDVLGEQVFQGNGILGNPLFDAAEDLADTAGRYEDADLSADADRLAEIADSDSTNGAELMTATSAIATVCGHPLGMNAVLGS